MRLIVGLGNPGAKYSMSRHNLGFMVVDHLSRMLGVNLKEEKWCQGVYGKGECQGEPVILLKPMTYMNESGTSVRKVADYFRLGVQDLLIVVDDVALPFGQMRVREAGSAGGHNGLRSIESCMGSQQYLRLRMGVGAPQEKKMVDHVLGVFHGDEREELTSFVEQGVEAVKLLCTSELSQAMMVINKKIQENKNPPRENEYDNRNSKPAL